MDFINNLANALVAWTIDAPEAQIWAVLAALAVLLVLIVVSMFPRRQRGYMPVVVIKPTKDGKREHLGI